MTRKAANLIEDELRGLGLGPVEWDWNSKTDVVLKLRNPLEPGQIVLERPADWDVWRDLLASTPLCQSSGEERDQRRQLSAAVRAVERREGGLGL